MGDKVVEGVGVALAEEHAELGDKAHEGVEENQTPYAAHDVEEQVAHGGALSGDITGE